MTALKPIENRRVRSVAAERYPLNKTCAHPECREDAVDPHHAFPRSAIGGDSWFVAVEYDETPTPEEPTGTRVEIIPHVTGLCRAHHDEVEQHRAWIKLEDGVWVWYWRVHDHPLHEIGKEDEWLLVGPLNPQPGSVEGKAKRKRHQGQARRQRKVISIRVPDDADENGAGLLDESVEALEEKIKPGDHRPIYHTLMSALGYTLLNADETDFEQ